MSDTVISFSNLYDFPIGTRIEFDWGCPVDTGGGDWPDDAVQHEEGLVVGHENNPHPMFPTAYLLVETERGDLHRVSRLVTKGVGAYLIPEGAK